MKFIIMVADLLIKHLWSFMNRKTWELSTKHEAFLHIFLTVRLNITWTQINYLIEISFESFYFLDMFKIIHF